MTDPNASSVTPLRPQIHCPQCKKPSNRTAYPFCSKRCADLDLGAWLGGPYRLSGDDDERIDLRIDDR
ncbi:MAG: DNA gyrase inhibitor YacG [Rhizobiaceae bacterium]|nr:DNA gyrase inhibitor YacG [Rhizobiaceae bacterium]